jgi:hypothetical protein
VFKLMILIKVPMTPVTCCALSARSSPSTYDYWSDKYGIEDTKYFDTNQNTASLWVKVFF